MQEKIILRLSPQEASDISHYPDFISRETGISVSRIKGFDIVRQSIDSRGRSTRIETLVTAFIDETYVEPAQNLPPLQNISKAEHTVIVAGAGPAGLFAALALIEQGIKPIIIDRGKDVRARRRDLAAINKEGVMNPESNYCFGEGGAGTYSDGKLYTRSNKRGDIPKILRTLVKYGAPEAILYEAHPHIGTNKLPGIITAIREDIIEHGGEVLFNARMTSLKLEGQNLKGVILADGTLIEGKALILATGHSARDVFEMLHHQNILIEAKPFALGVRVEHPQTLIDSIQYHVPVRDPYLPPASYSLVQQVEGHGVFSFCMCPGGIIAPAATAPGEIVVNGWSPSKRNNPFANSGIVVSVDEKDYSTKANDPLAAMRFQKTVEQKAYEAGGGNLKAPAQRLTDFVKNISSSTLPSCSYLPGVNSAKLSGVLPAFVYRSLADGFRAFDKKMKGYLTEEAIVVATESRTSSPVRIPRDAQSLQHPQISNLYPCGEGAGYAGGIVSAAMDGQRVSIKIKEQLSS